MLGFVLILAEMCLVATVPVLQCFVERQNSSSQCQLKRIQEITKPIIELKNDSTVSQLESGDLKRTNLTISIQKAINYDIMLQIQRDNEELQLWGIPIEAVSDHGFPFKIIIVVPFPTHVLRLHKSLPKGRACLSGRDLLECQEMSEMQIKLKSSKKNSLQLEILNKQVMYPLVVELLSGACQVACDGTPNNCTTHVASTIWENPAETIQFDALLPSFYCAQIVTISECCAICTTSLEITDAENELDSFFITATSSSLYFLCLTVIIIVALAGMLLWKTGRRESKNEDSGPPTTIKKDLLQPMLEHKIPCDIQILLLYPRKNNAFVQVMSSFRKVLEMYVNKVWDPFDSKQVEAVGENPFIWLQSVFMTQNLKIVNIQDDSNDQDCLTYLDFYDSVYVSVMSIIQHSPELAYDYSKLFNVRFNYQPVKLTDRVPNTRYELPQHLGYLICDVVGISQAQQESESYVGDELVEFTNRLKEYTDATQTYES